MPITRKKYSAELIDILNFYCNSNLVQNAEALLGKNSHLIDLLDKDGDFFGLAIARESKEMLNLLLTHYEKNHLCYPPESTKYKLAKSKLKEALEEIIDCNTPKDMLKILQPYLHIAPDYDEHSALEEYKADPGFDLDFDLPPDSHISDYHEQQTTSHNHLLGDSSPLLTST